MTKRIILCLLYCFLAASAFAQRTTGSITGNTQCISIPVNPNTSSSVAIQVTGTWSATLQPEVAVAGQSAVNTTVQPTGSTTSQSTITANGVYQAGVAGVDQFKLCSTAFVSGTAVIYMNVSNGVNANQLGSGAGSTGTVTSVTFTGDGVVLSSTPSAAVTTSGTLTAALAQAASGTFLGNVTGANAVPSYNPLSAINPQTATYQVLATDFAGYKTISVASGTFTITLVASGTQPANGQYITILNYGSGVVTVARSGQNINGAAANLTLNAGSASAPTSLEVWSDGTNYFATVDEGTVGTVTSVATTAPITGGTITNSGTIACATCVTSAAALTNGGVVVGGGGQASSTPTGLTYVTEVLTLGLAGTAGNLTFLGAAPSINDTTGSSFLNLNTITRGTKNQCTFNLTTAQLTTAASPVTICTFALPNNAQTWYWSCTAGWSVTAGTTPTYAVGVNWVQAPSSAFQMARIDTTNAGVGTQGTTTTTTNANILATGTLTTSATVFTEDFSGTFTGSATAGNFNLTASVTGTSATGTTTGGCYIY